MTTATVHINGMEIEAVRSVRFDDQTATIEYIPRFGQPTLDAAPKGSILQLTLHSDTIDLTHEAVLKGVETSKTDRHPARATTETVTLSLFSPMRLRSIGVADRTLDSTTGRRSS